MKTTCAIFLFCLILVLACSNAENKSSGSEELKNDTPTTTIMGNTFTAPQGWFLSTKGPATILEAPEKGSYIVLVDVEAENDSTALLKAWEAYKTNERSLEKVNETADFDGWTNQKSYSYRTSPNEKRSVIAGVMFANDIWTVWIYDMANDIGGKRGAQIDLLFNSILPKGYARETFAGKQANKLDTEHISEITKFIETAMEATGIPGVGLGIVENGKVVFADGFGVCKLGGDEIVDANTRFLIASNTKAMTTLLLARLVDAGKLGWETPVVDLMPSFRLGGEETTKQTLVEHLVCACTGLPRKDMELIFETKGITPEDLMSRLADTEPTTGFGEMYQYSNSLAAAAGYVAGHVMHPDLGIGEAYDQAMQSEVFDPLGMNATTFNYEYALSKKHADAHSHTIEGETGLVDMNLNFSVIHARPAGAAWSTVSDMLKYIEMELSEGTLPDGERYISKGPLLERRLEKVSSGENRVYGMGLEVENTYGIPVVSHGGDLFGQHSNMFWLPEQGVGVVVLTNGDPGWLISYRLPRKVLEVIFDGKPEADESLIAAAKRYFENIETNKNNYTIPAASVHVDKLAAEYINKSLGYIKVLREDSSTIFDFGEWSSEMATKINPDSTISLITISPGVMGFDFVVGSGERRQLILRDAQHEYIFEEN